MPAAGMAYRLDFLKGEAVCLIRLEHPVPGRR
jgi:hypothetical protein